MAQALFSGLGGLWPATALYNGNAFATNALLLDAAGERGAFVGRPSWVRDGNTTKTLTHLIWRTGGTIVVGASSQWRLSVQNASGSNPLVPDGTVDEHYTPAVGVAPTSGAWNRVALNTSRVVSRSDVLAFVWEWLTFNTGDVLQIGAPFTMTTLYRGLQCDTVLYSGSAWSSQAYVPNIILEFSDGSYGTLVGTHPTFNAGQQGFNNGSTGGGSGLMSGDERGIEFVPEVPMVVEGVWVEIGMGATAACDIVLYEGTTVLDTISLDGANLAATAVRRSQFHFDNVHVLAAGTTYRLMIKPTTANAVNYNYIQPGDDNYHPLYGYGVRGVNRVDGGAFATADAVYIPLLGLLLAGGDDGTGPDISGTHTISGVVYSDPAGTVPVSGATVRCIRQSDNGVLTTTTNGSGQYSFSVASGHLYHVVAEYNNAGQRHHWRSLFDLTPVAP